MWFNIDTNELYYGDKRVGFEDRAATLEEIELYNIKQNNRTRVTQLQIYLEETKMRVIQYLGDKTLGLTPLISDEEYIQLRNDRIQAENEISVLSLDI